MLLCNILLYFPLPFHFSQFDAIGSFQLDKSYFLIFLRNLVKYVL